MISAETPWSRGNEDGACVFVVVQVKTPPLCLTWRNFNEEQI